MKPARAPQAAPEAPVRVEFQVQFSGGPKGSRRVQDETTTRPGEKESSATPVRSPAPAPTQETSPDRLPKITRLLVLGHHFENLVREGVVKDYAEIARLTGLSRARVTQIANLTLLAPDIQEVVLSPPAVLTDGERLTEHDLRPMAAEVHWQKQRCTRSTLRQCGHHRAVDT